MISTRSPHPPPQPWQTSCRSSALTAAERSAVSQLSFTKRVRRGTLAELAEWAESERVRGEIVIVEGAQAPRNSKRRTSCSWFSTV